MCNVVSINSPRHVSSPRHVDVVPRDLRAEAAGNPRLMSLLAELDKAIDHLVESI